MRVLFALSGLHRVERGAEIAFTQIARNLAAMGDEVTLIGSGSPRPDSGYRFIEVPVVRRERFERFPRFPAFRTETAWEDASFMPGLMKAYRPADHDITLTCAYPFTNWALRRPTVGGRRPPHVFVTQNGDWPARSDQAEFGFFGCEGLVCTNPDYHSANKDRYHATLIPNGVDLGRFAPGQPQREQFGLPSGVPIVLMVSAMIESKFIDVGIDAVSRLPGVHLVVAGDGPLRDTLHAKAKALMPDRFHTLTTTADRMPALYRSADAFLHLSRDESFGNVFVEAMACGIPTVAWDLERTRWITGDTAMLVADGDRPALIDALSAAIGRGDPDPGITAHADQYSWSSIAKRYRLFLTDVVERHQSFSLRTRSRSDHEQRGSNGAQI